MMILPCSYYLVIRSANKILSTKNIRIRRERSNKNYRNIKNTALKVSLDEETDILSGVCGPNPSYRRVSIFAFAGDTYSNLSYRSKTV